MSFMKNVVICQKFGVLIKKFIMMGDFNINWKDNYTGKRLKQITNGFQLFQLIQGLTRITKIIITNSTKTQKDYIFSNKPE